MIKTKKAIQLARRHLPVGSTLELDAAEEARLVEQGDAELLDGDEDDALDEKLDAEDALSPDARAFAKMHAADAIEFVGTIATLSELFAYSAVESGRKGGPRKTVQEALTQQVIDLATPSGTPAV